MWRASGGRTVNRGGAGALAAAAVALVAGILLGGAEPALANHQCAATGSPFGPFDIETDEAAEPARTRPRIPLFRRSYSRRSPAWRAAGPRAITPSPTGQLAPCWHPMTAATALCR